jgi:HD-GYP domain-containing protein (c-di-GMP phosphodiesterase class II)
MRSVRRLLTLAGNLLQANIDTAQVLGSAIAKRDSDTSEHNFRVTIVSVRIAERCGLDRRTIRDLIKGSFVHDVGKIAISETILLKPGRLTAEEFEVVKGHVREGVALLERSAWLAGGVPVVRHHHEKYDGSGYLAGLKGEQIPIAARIFALADVFDALTSRRPYKGPLGFECAMAVLQRGSGTHFDPRVLAAFTPIARELYEDLVASPNERPGAILRQIVQDYFSHPASELPAA